MSTELNTNHLVLGQVVNEIGDLMWSFNERNYTQCTRNYKVEEGEHVRYLSMYDFLFHSAENDTF